MTRAGVPLVLMLALVLVMGPQSSAAVRSRRALSPSDRSSSGRSAGAAQQPSLFRYYVLDRQGAVERTFLSPYPAEGLAPARGPLPQLDSVVATIGTIVNAEVASMGGHRQSTVAPQVARYPTEPEALSSPQDWPQVDSGVVVYPETEQTEEEWEDVDSVQPEPESHGEDEGVDEPEPEPEPLSTADRMKTAPAVAPVASPPAAPAAPPPAASAAPPLRPSVMSSVLTPAEIELLSQLNVALLSDPEVAMTTEVPLGEVAYMQTERTTPSEIHYFVPASPTPNGEQAGSKLRDSQLAASLTEALEGRVSSQGKPIEALGEPIAPIGKPVVTRRRPGSHTPVRSPTLTGISAAGIRPYSPEDLAALEESLGEYDEPLEPDEPLPLHPMLEDSRFTPFLSHSIASRFIPGAFTAPGQGAGTGAGPGSQGQDSVPPSQEASPLLINRETLSAEQLKAMENLMEVLSSQDQRQTTNSEVSEKEDSKTPTEGEAAGPDVVDASGAGPSDITSSEQATLDADDLLIVPSRAASDSADSAETDRAPAATSTFQPSPTSASPVAAPPVSSTSADPEPEDGSGAGADPPAVRPVFTLSSLFRPGALTPGGFLSFSGEVGSGQEDGSGEAPVENREIFSELPTIILDREDDTPAQARPAEHEGHHDVHHDGHHEVEDRQEPGHEHHEAHDESYYMSDGGEKHHHEGADGHHGDHEGGHHHPQEGEGDHGDHGDHHGNHGDHGDHGNHGEHGDHGDHGAHGAAHGAHGAHGDHGGHHPADHGSSVSASSAGLRSPPAGSLGAEDTLLEVDESTDAFVENLNRVSLALYRGLAPDYRRQNMVLSPLAVGSSLAQLYLGARGDTAHQLDELLKLDSMTSFNPHVGYFKFLRYINDAGPQSAVCNALLTDKKQGDIFSGYQFLLSRFYNPVIESNADLKSAPGAAIQDSINPCVSNWTGSLVTDFINKPEKLPAVSPSLVAASGTFFNASLAPSLDVQPVDTTFLRFPSALRRVLATAGLRVRGTLWGGYSRELDCTVAALPYADGKLQLVLLLPGTASRFNADGLSRLEARLSPAAWRQLLRAATPQPMEVTLPIISHRTETELRPLLGKLGVRDAQTAGAADFSGVNGLRDLNLGGLLQVTEFHLGDGSVLHAGHGAQAGHGGEHGGHGDHGSHGDHDKHGDHGSHGGHGDHGSHGDHGAGHEDHGAHGDHGDHSDHSDHSAHGDHGNHGEHENHGNHVDHGDHGDHSEHGEHTEHGSGPSPTDGDDLTFPTLPSPTFSDRTSRFLPSQWTVGPDRLPWEEATREAQEPLPSGTPLTRLHFDRAFLYAVRDEATGAILLMGRYLDPHSFV